MINSILKFIVLYDTLYHHWSPLSLIAHVILSSAVEHTIFATVTVFLLMLRNDAQLLTTSVYGKYYRRLYFALAFPEYFKMIAILLQVFDSEPKLLMLFGVLLLSIQCRSVQNFTHKPFHRIFPVICISMTLKLMVKAMWFDFNSILIQGVIL